MARMYDKSKIQDVDKRIREGRIQMRKYRTPPSGLMSCEFRLCKQYEMHKTCRFGLQCIEAHGIEELEEWQHSWTVKKDRVIKHIESKAHERKFLQRLHSLCVNSQSGESHFASSLPFVELVLRNDTSVTITAKPAMTKWMFVLKTSNALQNVALLQDNYREHFKISSVQLLSSKGVFGTIARNHQEWSCNNVLKTGVFAVTVKFKANVFGSFNQTVVFDFGSKPYLSKRLTVDIYPANEGLQLSEDGKQLTISFEEQWTEDNSEIIPLNVAVTNAHNTILNERYPSPGRGFTFPASLQDSVMHVSNYRERMHSLLYVEELAQAKILSHFNLSTKLILSTHYILSPGPLSTAKYCTGKNELFAKIELNTKISEDTSAGRLILNNCNVALLSFGTTNQGKRRVYECLVEDKTKDAIYLRLNERLVTDLQLQHDSECTVQAQFQLNREPFFEKHWAIDLCPTPLLFPDTSLRYRFSNINCNLEPKLNTQQRQAVICIASDNGVFRPPVIISGPFGTGKTFTFAQSIEVILQQPNTRILVCTHSNSAADLYVKEYLHTLVQNGFVQYRPLRIYYRERWLATVHHTVLEYCLVESDPYKNSSFRLPTMREIEQHRVIVTTLATTSYLLQASIPKGFFTHILIDEAAQCTECDVLLPLSLADEKTRIALAGDHMQLSPEIFSQVARDHQFQVSLLERLYDRYPMDFPCRIVLCDNYRSHSAIVQFTSELFYDNRLTSVGNNARHPDFCPLSFYVAKGTDIQDPNSTSYYNAAEVYEIGEIVGQLLESWPVESWGPFDDSSIGIVTPYADQVTRIRAHLRTRKLFGVSVERVLNVQGKQFRVIILSTVRTRNTCINDEKEERSKKKKIIKNDDDDEEEDSEEDEMEIEDEESQFGFLSSARLLNTAVTRARSLVIVVGDPLALCSVGKCRKLWERYIEFCRNFDSLKGVSWMQLRSHLDAIEMKKLYGLNPMAPEFVPKVLRAGQPLIIASPSYSMNLSPFYPPPTVFPSYPPPPSFHPQWFIPCSPHRQAHVPPTRNIRPRIIPLGKPSNYTPPPSGLGLPPPVTNHLEQFGNLNSSLNSSPLNQINPLQGVNPSPRLSSSGNGNLFSDLQAYRGADITYGSCNRDGQRGIVSPAHRAISKPLTVQQLEAALLKKETKLETETSWPSSPNNGSIWTPLTGPSLWNGPIFSKEEESSKNDSVPLYLRTSNSNSQLSDDDMDLFVNSFLSAEDEPSSDDEDVPLWAEGIEDVEEDIDVKTLQFEESVLRPIRNEGLLN